MSAMQRIVQRILQGRELPDRSASEDDFTNAINSAVDDFENSGFLEKNAFTTGGHIKDEAQLMDTLVKHKNDLVVIKFWKRRCLPCLSLAEMYKAAEEKFENDVNKQLSTSRGGKVVFYSMNTKEESCMDTCRYQLVEGTPTILTFKHYKQVGEEIKKMKLDELCAELHQRREW